MLAVLDRARQDQFGQRVLQMLLDHPFQRACAISGLVAAFGQPFAGIGRQIEHDLALLEQFGQPHHLDIDNRPHFIALQAMEQDDFVDAVEEFGPEMGFDKAHHIVPHRLAVLAFGLVDQIFRPEIRGHDDQRVAEIDRAALPVGQAAIVEHLQQDVEHVGMGFLDFVEQHDLIGPPSDGLGQGPAFLVADIAGRCADQAGDRVLFHIFRHVDAQQSAFVIEHETGQSLGQLGFADAGRPQEHERADRTMGVLQARPCTAHGGSHRMDGFDLADNPFAELGFHHQEFFFFARQHPFDRHTGPARHDLRDVVGAHGLVNQCGALGLLAFDGDQPLFEVGDQSIGQFAGLLIFALALGIGEIIAGLF